MVFPEKPDIPVITLVGSTKFPKLWHQAMKDWTLRGYIVHTVGLFGHQEGIDMSGNVKRMLDKIYMRKIELSDAILVLNEDYAGKPYIGMGAWDEIFYAIALNKRAVFSKPLKGACKDDLLDLCKLEGWSIPAPVPFRDSKYFQYGGISEINPD